LTLARVMETVSRERVGAVGVIALVLAAVACGEDERGATASNASSRAAASTQPSVIVCAPPPNASSTTDCAPLTVEKGGARVE
jgi:hypothetical protein